MKSRIVITRTVSENITVLLYTCILFKIVCMYCIQMCLCLVTCACVSVCFGLLILLSNATVINGLMCHIQASETGNTNTHTVYTVFVTHAAYR